LSLVGYKLKETTEFIDNLRFIITLVKGVFDLQFDGLGLGCLMPLSTIFQLYRGGIFYSFKIYLCFFFYQIARGRLGHDHMVKWIYDHLCNQCLSPIRLWVRIPCHFQQYFSYIVAVSFIGGGNRSIQRKPQTCRKSLTNFIT
jgi:hypothetical protein